MEEPNRRTRCNTGTDDYADCDPDDVDHYSDDKQALDNFHGHVDDVLMKANYA